MRRRSGCFELALLFCGPHLGHRIIRMHYMAPPYVQFVSGTRQLARLTA